MSFVNISICLFLSFAFAFGQIIFRYAAAYNLTGTRELPLPSKLVSKPPEILAIPAFWSSSNGALYSMVPVRRGLLPWEDLWMGWEDLEYGWRLSDHGYRQVIVSHAVFEDNYEYEHVGTAVGVIRLIKKPVWLTYYNFRNLILVTRRTRPTLRCATVVFFRIFLELFVIILRRSEKRLRLRYLLTGVSDGLRNRMGKWEKP